MCCLVSAPRVIQRPLKGKGHRMLYALLCYDSEDVVGAWTKEQDAEAIARLEVVQEKLAKQGRLGPVARLMPTTAATTLRKGKESVVLDGPFAETKEQLLGFFIVECASLEEAIEAARRARPGQQQHGGLRDSTADGAGSPGALRHDRCRVHRHGRARRSPSRGRRSVALLPRPRPRRRSVSGGVPERAQELAEQWAAARSRGAG